jgi:hypothetical protein
MPSETTASPARALINIALATLLGILAATLFLVFKPARQAAEPPAAPERGTVYFVKGKTHPGAARLWAEKRARINKGLPFDMELREQELNAWMASGFAAEKPSSFSLSPESPNFRLADGALQIALPFKLTLFGKTFPVVLQARGKITRDADGFIYAPEEIHAGSLPLHAIGLGGFAFRKATGLLEQPGDIAAAWRKLTVAEINGNVLHLVSP